MQKKLGKKMKEKFKPEHINVTEEDLIGNNGAGRYLFFPGSDHRAASISEHFKNRIVKKHSRGHNFYMGTLEEEGRKIGLDKKTHTGIIHSKDSLYGREFEEGPLAHHNTDYMKILMKGGVIASEMEASMLFVLSSLYDSSLINEKKSTLRVLAGTVCFIISAGPGFVDDACVKKYTDELTQLAIQTFFELNKNESNLILS